MRKNKKQTVRLKADSETLRDLYRFTRSILGGMLYNIERDRYELRAGDTDYLLDREYYNTLCGFNESLAAAVATSGTGVIL